MEFLEDYNFTINYHPGKANVVADALSRKGKLSNLNIYPKMYSEILKAQEKDEMVQKLKSMMKPDFRIDTNGILRFINRVVVPAEIKEKVLSETHQTKYSIHPGGTKMYKDLNGNSGGRHEEGRCKLY